jgi:class 3 adenylate cyclase
LLPASSTAGNWFGNPRNVSRRLRQIADDLGVAIHVAV